MEYARLKQKEEKKKPDKSFRGKGSIGRVGAIIILLLSAFCALYARLRLLDMPFERDEGEYAYIGQLFLQGIAPFKAAYTMKLPGTSVFYAFSMLLFGQTVSAVHLGLFLLNIGTALTLYFLSKRWLRSAMGASFTAVFFLLASLCPATLGFAGHAMHYVLFFAIAGILLLDRAFDHTDWWRYTLSGFFFCASVMMKQPGIYFTAFALFLFIRQGISKIKPWKQIIKNGLSFSLGYICPIIVLLVSLIVGGTGRTFLYWIFQYGMQYAVLLPVNIGIDNFWLSFLPIFKSTAPCWCLAAIGIFICLLRIRSSRLQTISVYFLFSFLALTPGLYFREHYFLVVIPSIGLLASIAVLSIDQFLQQKLRFPFGMVLLISFTLCWCLLTDKAFYFETSEYDILRSTYGVNPFPESVPIAHYIATHSAPSDCIAILGSEPQIYFYANRRSASPYIYMYSLMEQQRYSHAMQTEFIQDIETKRPKYLIFCNIPPSWRYTPLSDMTLFQWVDSYLNRNYIQTGVVELVGFYDTRYRWDKDAIGYHSQANSVYIFERRSDIGAP
jgi:hypothetical protein